MFRIHQASVSALALLLSVTATTTFAQGDGPYDPPARVARLAYVSGEVSVAPAGSDDWSAADRNRPLVAGDRLWSGGNGRAALDFGNASVRVDRDSAFDFAALDDRSVRVVLSQGTLNLSVRRFLQGQDYEIDTPTLAFVPTEEGSYRIDIDPDGSGAMVTIFRGSGTAWGANDSRRDLVAGQSYRFDSADLDRVVRRALPYGNDFDRFCADLDAEYARSTSAQYVADNMIGYHDLDTYGRWSNSTEYGPVWYPTQVAVDWAPYRYGHWAWIQPWGWTWVDDAPWGFAPFHYGRWALIGTRWGWVPGPRLRAAVYAPALVAFVGNIGISIGGPVGWFPLGPRDVYLPPYRVSRDYFCNINLAGGRFFERRRIAGMYADYRNDRWQGRHDYAYRHTPRAVTAVPSDVFTHARPVARSTERIDEAVLQRAPVKLAPSVKPLAASIAPVPRGTPPQGADRAFSRNVVSRVPVNRGSGVPRAAPTASTVPNHGVARQLPAAPTRTAPVQPRPATLPATLPRSAPATRSPVVRAPQTRSVYTPTSMPRQQPATTVPQRTAPTAAPRNPVVSTPAPLPRSRPVPAAPSRTQPTTRSTSAPIAVPRAQPATPTRSYTPTALPRTQPSTPTRSYTPTSMPRVQPTTPTRSSTPAAAPSRSNTKSSGSTSSGSNASHGKSAAGVMPRGRPGH